MQKIKSSRPSRIATDKTIEVLAAVDIDTLESRGSDVWEPHCETVADAKRRARYLLTDEYRIASECSTRLGYARVVVDGVCVADYFGQGA